MKLTEDEKLELIIRRMQTDASVDAPAASLKYAKDIFRTRSTESSSLLKRIVGVLTADLAGGRPAFGERSTSSSTVRQALFTAEDNAVDFRISKSGELCDLRGQVLGEGFDNADVIVRSGEREFRATSNDDGEFAVDAIPVNSASIEITGPESTIVVQLDL
jgi:hypothetical protein